MTGRICSIPIWNTRRIIRAEPAGADVYLVFAIVRSVPSRFSVVASYIRDADDMMAK